jgi:hypothetical protein
VSAGEDLAVWLDTDDLRNLADSARITVHLWLTRSVEERGGGGLLEAVERVR